MLKVYKYEIPIQDEFSLTMDRNAKILKVENQGDKPYMWALVDPDKEMITRKFLFVGTGQRIDYCQPQLKHISTFQVQGGRYIFHIFQII